ncbi:MAG: DUF1501 domain-containing protein [Capsulimonadaceae bacterium]|nr:DUF1501 domain-containing protein [Capsulimonadaceae bacterium]
MEVSRRDLLRRSAVVAVGLAVPPWLSKMVWADGGAAMGFHKDVPQDRILVVVQLSGGNDGLNTVIPYADAAYYKARPTIGIPDNQVLALSDSIGLNPAMTSLKALWDQKQVAIVQGVGYPNPNRSHFRSMEIWQTAAPDKIETEGWVGKYLDAIRNGRASSLTGINIGGEENLAIESAHAAVPSIQGLANFGVIFPGNAQGQARQAALRQIQLADSTAPNGAYIKQTAAELYDSADRIHAGVAMYKSTIKYGRGSLSQSLQQIAMLINANLGTRVYYVSYGGFDTHNQQSRRQPDLLREYGDAVKSFMDDLSQMGFADKVALVTFSEFGRRVNENASLGTDHGTASEMIVVGGGVKGGLYGAYPSLTDLDQGDLKFTTDFRSVYATVLDRWMGADSERVLGGKYDNLEFI